MKSNEKPHIAIIMSLPEEDREISSRTQAILQGLGRTNLQITQRFGRKTANSPLDDYDKIAKELVALNPDAIFSSCYPTMKALRDTTTSIPIVYAGLFDSDMVSLPPSAKKYEYSGNVTGFVSQEFDVCTQWPALLREIAPHMTGAAVIHEGSPAGNTQYAKTEAASPGFVSEIKVAVGDPSDKLEKDVASFKKDTPSGGLIVTTGALTAGLTGQIIQLAAKYGLPAIYPNRLSCFRGGLVSYGTDLLDLYRGAGIYLGKILDGAQPSALATQINRYSELVINLNTAASLALQVSRAMTDRASLLIGG